MTLVVPHTLLLPENGVFGFDVIWTERRRPHDKLDKFDNF